MASYFGLGVRIALFFILGIAGMMKLYALDSTITVLPTFYPEELKPYLILALSLSEMIIAVWLLSGWTPMFARVARNAIAQDQRHLLSGLCIRNPHLGKR